MGGFTRKGQTLYYHCWMWPGSDWAIGGLKNSVKSVRFLHGPEIAFTQTGDRLLFHDLPQEAPDPLMTVIEMEVEGEPRYFHGIGYVEIANDTWAV